MTQENMNNLPSNLETIQQEGTNKRLVEFFDEQYEAYNFTTQYGLAVAGVQSGKTLCGAYWSATKIVDNPGKCGLICAPTYKILQHSTLQKFFGEFPHFRKYYKEGKSEILLPDGTTIFIRSADQPLGIEGMTIHWAWLDEGGMMPALMWTIIRSRVSMTRGQVFITTTPYNMGWLYREFYLPWLRKEDDDLSVFSWESIKNPFFPKEHFEKERLRLRPEEFSRRYQGKFQRMQGLVFNIPTDKIIPRRELNPDVTLGGIDWGFNNPAAIWIGKRQDRIWYSTEEWYETQKTTPEIIEKAKEFQSLYKVNRWYADAAEPDRILECQRAGLYVLAGTKDLIGSISYINQLIRESKFYVFDHLKNLIDEVETYRYPEQKDDKQPEEVPEDAHNHLISAMRYAIGTYQGIPKRTFEVKRLKPKQPYFRMAGY